MFPIYERGKIGYIDRIGEIVIEPQLDSESYFRKRPGESDDSSILAQRSGTMGLHRADWKIRLEAG